MSEVAKHIVGMVFLGTPFGGSFVAGWGEQIRRVFDLAKKTDQKTLKHLKQDSQELRDLRKAFPDVIRKRSMTADRVGVVFFYERLATFGVQVILIKLIASALIN